MKTFVIGDIHGAHRALVQCLDRSGFDKKHDRLITLGDIADGWSEVPECVEELLTIENRIDIKGNHDAWLDKYLHLGLQPELWIQQGGKASRNAYIKTGKLVDERHRKFFREQHYYYVDEKNRLFVHGGFDWHTSIKEQLPADLLWDRHAFTTACMWEVFNRKAPKEKQVYFKDYSEIFVGHTATVAGINWRIGNTDKPLHVANMWNLDQGAGWYGKLTIMDVETKEYWQSDQVQDLYPNEKGRG